MDTATTPTPGRKTPTVRAKRTRVAPAASGRRRHPATAADDPLSSSRTRALADYLGVSPSQPSRWASGKERPGPAAAPMLIDLEHVLAKARLVWGETAAQTWMSSANVYLDGARPVDVIRVRGVAPVIEALDAEAWGGAA